MMSSASVRPQQGRLTPARLARQKRGPICASSSALAKARLARCTARSTPAAAVTWRSRCCVPASRASRHRSASFARAETSGACSTPMSSRSTALEPRSGAPGFWMELIRGTTLTQLLRALGPFTAEQAAIIGCDLCRALAAVHDAGVVHGDVKAQNVMREEGGRVVLMDFGSSRCPEQNRTGLRAPHRHAGIPGAGSPERQRAERRFRHLQPRRAALSSRDGRLPRARRIGRRDQAGSRQPGRSTRDRSSRGPAGRLRQGRRRRIESS